MKLTHRGQIVFGISLLVTGLVAFAGLVWIADHINWVGDHYCFHSSLQCYGLDK
jgi:hypothetical protein